METPSKKNDLVIQKSDKGASIDLIHKIHYLDKMNKILSHSKKTVESSVVDEKHLNFIIETAKNLSNLL